MAEAQKGKGASSPAAGSGAPVSEDWEAAFKAEDYMFSPEAEEGAIPAAPEVGDIPVAPFEEAAAKALGEVPEKTRGSRFSALADRISPGTWPGTAAALARATVLPRYRRLLSLSPARRLLVAGAAFFVLSAAGGILLYGMRPSPPPAAVSPEAEEYAAPAPAAVVAEQALPQAEKQPERSSPHEAEDSDAGEPSAIVGKVRWPLAAFLISAIPEEGARVPVLISVEVTLIAAEGAAGELRAEHVGRVRDIVYQFFANRPLSELRRYSIARGDMKRDLLAWIKKQWSGTTVEAVQVNRYQTG